MLQSICRLARLAGTHHSLIYDDGGLYIFGCFADVPPIAVAGRPGLFAHMLLWTPVVHPPFQVPLVATAFGCLRASFEDHVRMFLLKECQEAKLCSSPTHVIVINLYTSSAIYVYRINSCVLHTSFTQNSNKNADSVNRVDDIQVGYVRGKHATFR